MLTSAKVRNDLVADSLSAIHPCLSCPSRDLPGFPLSFRGLVAYLQYGDASPSRQPAALRGASLRAWRAGSVCPGDGWRGSQQPDIVDFALYQGLMVALELN